MATANIEIPDKLVEVFTGEADVRGAHGGRGSGKTRTFAKMTAVRALMWASAGRQGIILCGRQFMNSLDDSSLEEVKAAIQSEPMLLPHFEIGEKYIRTKDGNVDYKFAGLDRNISSVKSKSRILLCWVDEAEPVTENAWQVLIPTLREEDSELWVTWNPEREDSATHKRFRLSDNPRFKVAQLNYRDNPWFPALLDRTRVNDAIERPDQYAHVWEGDFKSIAEGAYYAAAITKAREDHRIGRLEADPHMTLRAIWDIGGTGAKADACAIWIAQYVGKEIRWLDYYEKKGQPLAAHINWLRDSGYGKAYCILPHDGASNDKVHDVSYQSALQAAGFEVRVIPNQGKGAAMQRVEIARKLFPNMWFNEERCAAGLKAIGWYHPNIDHSRGVDLGPKHDSSSHGADSFGLGAVEYEMTADDGGASKPFRRQLKGIA